MLDGKWKQERADGQQEQESIYDLPLGYKGEARTTHFDVDDPRPIFPLCTAVICIYCEGE